MNMKFAAARRARHALRSPPSAPQRAGRRQRFLSRRRHHPDQLRLSRRWLGSDDVDDNGFKIIAGLRPLDWLAVEANYMDLGGDSEDGTVDRLERASRVSALVLAEIGIVDLYARAGMAKWDTEFSVDGVGSVSDDGWEPTYGVGVGVHFGSVGVRAEYERFSAEAVRRRIDDRHWISDTISLSVTYTFL